MPVRLLKYFNITGLQKQPHNIYMYVLDLLHTILYNYDWLIILIMHDDHGVLSLLEDDQRKGSKLNG